MHDFVNGSFVTMTCRIMKARDGLEMADICPLLFDEIKTFPGLSG